MKFGNSSVRMALAVLGVVAFMSGCPQIDPLAGGALTVSTTAISTSEGGSNGSFTVALSKAPTGNVNVKVTSYDIGEGLLIAVVGHCDRPIPI